MKKQVIWEGGSTLERLRSEAKMSRITLADATAAIDPDGKGVHHRTIYDIEKGVAKDYKVSTLALLAAVLPQVSGFLIPAAQKEKP